MFEEIENNLEKFEYKYRCICNRQYLYKNIIIEYVPGFIVGFDVNLLIDGYYVDLSKKECRKLKKIYIKLDNLRNELLKEKIIKNLRD